VVLSPTKRSVSQVSIVGPLDESNLRNQLRLDPHHFRHLFRRHASAPMGSLAVREIHERTLRDLQREQSPAASPNALHELEPIAKWVRGVEPLVSAYLCIPNDFDTSVLEPPL